MLTHHPMAIRVQGQQDPLVSSISCFWFCLSQDAEECRHRVVAMSQPFF